MTNLLIKLFIKDYEQITNSRVRTSYGLLASIVGILCNVLLFIVKIVIGFIINSISIMADAFNNLSDAGSSIIGFIGVKLAGKPADQDHPFGHGRIEYISALIVSFLILFVGISLFKNSIKKIVRPEEIGFSWIIIVILIISVLIKVWLYLFNKKLANNINSNLLKATSTDARNDAVITLATICSIGFSKIFGITIDGWIGLAVSIFVLISGFQIAKDMILPLLGESVDREVYEKLTAKIKSYEGIIGTHDLIMHNYGPSHTMATVHVEVSNLSNIETIHETIDQIERDVLSEMDIFLVIHMDPIEVNDKEVVNCREIVHKTVKEIEPEADVHDFRLVNGEHVIILLFDIVVPYSYCEKDENELLIRVETHMKTINSKYQCVITFDKSYISE